MKKGEKFVPTQLVIGRLNSESTCTYCLMTLQQLMYVNDTSTELRLKIAKEQRKEKTFWSH